MLGALPRGNAQQQVQTGAGELITAVKPLKRRALERGARTVLLSLVLAMGGCGGVDDVQFNGKIFDAIGMNSSTKSTEPKMKVREGLVMPPNVDRLPEPGKPAESVAADVAALNDPDKVAKLSHEEQERQQQAYCKVNYDDAKTRGDDTTADNAVGPLGPCKKSVITAIQNWTKGESSDDDDDNQVEH
jgi:hypothetical protein